MKDRRLQIILLTALLEVVSLGIIIPILPFIIRSFGLGSEWVGISYSVSSVGMFAGGMIFGRLSDKFGRKRILSFTVILNIISYIIFAFSTNILIFIFARLLSGFASAGISVAQAYITDISKPEERTKNMGMIGAMFGVGFILGPVFGGLFSGHSLQSVGLISASLLSLNAIVIWFILPESKKILNPNSSDGLRLGNSKDIEEAINPIDFCHNKKQLLVLFIVSFGTSLGFSGNQGILPLFLNDVHHITEKNIAYYYAFLGVMISFYQGIALRYTRKIFKEKGLVVFGLSLFSFAFLLFATNRNHMFILPIIALFPIAYGSINPGIGSLIARYAGKETGKAMGTNVSAISIGNIAGPLIAGFSYKYLIELPYMISSVIFLFTLLLVLRFIKK